MAPNERIATQNLSPTSQMSFWNSPFPYPKDKPIPIGLDIGYSSTKIRGIYGQHIFPSFLIRAPRLANPLSAQTLFGEREADLKYKDEYGTVWYVGEKARRNLIPGRVNQDDTILYGRNRIKSEEYRVLLRLGIFFGLLKPDFTLDKRPLRLTTGLPANFLQDEVELRKHLRANGGFHRFSVQIGGRDWMDVQFQISDAEVAVLPQPLGTIFSVATDYHGDVTDSELIMKHHLLICDAGFHTVDTYETNGGDTLDTMTWEDCGMQEVYALTVNDIWEHSHKTISVTIHQLDSYMKNGTISYIVPSQDPSDRTINTQHYDFTAHLAKNLRSIAERLTLNLSAHYHLQEINRIIVTGGTGKLFFPYLRENLGGNVELAERTHGKHDYENFDPVFANVVGFLNYQIGAILNQPEKEEVAVTSEEKQEDTPKE